MVKEKDKDLLPIHRFTGHQYSRLLNLRRGTIPRLIAVATFIVILYLLFGPTRDQSATQPPFPSSERNDTVDLSWNERLNWRRGQEEEIISRRSIYSPEMFQPKALKTNGLKPVTVVLLGWKRQEGLKTVVQYLAKYPYFKEILIWNNNKQARLNVKDFELNSTNAAHLEIRVFNSDENLHDLSKYTTCSMARYDHCYFQDDDWLNLYLDSIYTNFLRYPNLIHSNTMPIIHLEHRRWQFTNPAIDMHTGFTWLGCGAFIPRSKVLRFLAQLGSNGLSKDRLRVADMYFSIWTNQYPYQMSNPLTPLDQKEGWSDGVDQWRIVYQNIFDASSKLYEALAANAVDHFMREEEQPRPDQRDTRAPCLNDKCLFLTNIDPFPLPTSVVFDNVNVTQVRMQETQFDKLDFPSNDFWTKHAYHYAVDRDDNTCWNSYKAPHAGDYFGLHMLTAINSKHVTILSSQNINHLENVFAISTSTNGDRWVTCKYQPLKDAVVSSDPHRLHIGFLCPAAEPFRFLRIEFQRDLPEPFEVCSLGLEGFNV